MKMTGRLIVDRLLKCVGQYSLVKPILEYPPPHRFPCGSYPKEIDQNENLRIKPIWEQIPQDIISTPQEVNGAWENNDQGPTDSMMDLCMIEEDNTIDPLCFITRVKECIPDYLLIKDTDKTTDHLPPSTDPFVCDCWKRVQIERMKTRWDGPYFTSSKILPTLQVAS